MKPQVAQRHADVIGMTTTKTAPFIVLALLATAIVSIAVINPEGDRTSPTPAAAVVTTIVSPATSAPPATTTTTSTAPAKAVSRVARHASTTEPAAPVSTVPAEMPHELEELQKRIPGPEAEMEADDFEHMPHDDSPEIATDWIQ